MRWFQRELSTSPSHFVFLVSRLLFSCAPLYCIYTARFSLFCRGGGIIILSHRVALYIHQRELVRAQCALFCLGWMILRLRAARHKMRILIQLLNQTAHSIYMRCAGLSRGYDGKWKHCARLCERKSLMTFLVYHWGVAGLCSPRRRLHFNAPAYSVEERKRERDKTTLIANLYISLITCASRILEV